MVFKELKEIRLRNGLTQQEMADKLRITLNYYNKLERGKRDPSFKLIRRICEVFDLHLFGIDTRLETVPKQSEEEAMSRKVTYVSLIDKKFKQNEN